MSSKAAKLILLTGLTPEESADIESQHLIKDGSLLLLIKDERRIMGYTTDGELAFIGLDVRRQKGTPIELESLPSVGHQIERLADLGTEPLHVIELEVEADAGATFVFTRGVPASPADFVGYTNTTMPLSRVQQVVDTINESYSTPGIDQGTIDSSAPLYEESATFNR